MEKNLEELYQMCEFINAAIKEANEKIRKAGSKLNAGDVDYIDKLSSALKAIKTSIAMIKSEDDYSERGYSRDGMSYERRDTMRDMPNRIYPGGGSYGTSYNTSYDDMSYGDSYARGRGRNARRDNMGRYSSEHGYSRDDAKKDMMSDLREIMQDAPDERTRQEFQRFMTKLEQM